MFRQICSSRNYKITEIIHENTIKPIKLLINVRLNDRIIPYLLQSIIPE